MYANMMIIFLYILEIYCMHIHVNYCRNFLDVIIIQEIYTLVSYIYDILNNYKFIRIYNVPFDCSV